ncbi:MAG: ABC transporter involved in cytochrome c biogenesis, ATPase component CcmA [Ignavibacteriae bacterium]|nr:MAG: ABC transporter involved in cytochrome c biogenesis, ATPase component CcmA [Ignavibacteriota bacterium]
MLRVEAINIKKNFGNRKIFSNINFTLDSKNVLGITGKNGSGKSTLVKIIAGIISATNGEVKYFIDQKHIEQPEIYKYYGFVSPYLQLYEEFSAFENLELISKIRNIMIDENRILSLLERFGLLDRKDDYVREYSSGMKQRLKYAAALYHKPDLLILDEPRSNLDSDGIRIVYDIIQEHKEKGSIIIATNDLEDIQLCNNIIDLNRIPK